MSAALGLDPRPALSGFCAQFCRPQIQSRKGLTRPSATLQVHLLVCLHRVPFLWEWDLHPSSTHTTEPSSGALGPCLTTLTCCYVPLMPRRDFFDLQTFFIVKDLVPGRSPEGKGDDKSAPFGLSPRTPSSWRTGQGSLNCSWEIPGKGLSEWCGVVEGVCCVYHSHHR